MPEIVTFKRNHNFVLLFMRRYYIFRQQQTAKKNEERKSVDGKQNLFDSRNVIIY